MRWSLRRERRIHSPRATLPEARRWARGAIVPKVDSAILADLRNAYDSGDLIVFVGAGVSAAAGLPTWKALAERLLERVRGAGKEGTAIDEIEDLIRSGQLIDALSAARHALGEEEFNREVEKALTHKGAVPSVLRAIADLKPKLRAVLTTNIDRLLEKAFAGEWEDFEDPPGDVAARRHYILKLHGTLGKHKTWVFSRDQYDQAMFGRPQLQDTFGALYLAHPILFVGFGLADENIDLTLGKVRARSQGQPPSHYALMPESSVGPSRRKKLEAAGVRLLLYKNADGKHAEVEQVLRSLAGEATSPAASVPDLVAPAPKTAPAPAPSPGPAPAPAAPTAARKDPAAPLAVFFCHASRDKELLERLQTHTALLKRERLISGWHEGEIGAGQVRQRALEDHLDAADLILLLISADFLASEQGDAQVARAMERHAAGEARVVPILLRPCDWKESRFKDLVVLPRDQVAVTRAKDQDEAFAQIATELRSVVADLRSGRRR
jgi:hypothetical protein